MRIQIIGTESLGVRGLCCVVKTKKQRIIIDPGVALGYRRHGLLPHPFQVAVGEKVKEDIIKELKTSTDIVISHFHGDHIPLDDANPYQLDAKKVASYFEKPRLWCKGNSEMSALMRKRRGKLSNLFDRSLPSAEGKKDGLFEFSKPVFHGEPHNGMGTVMMTRIEDEKVFVHASDIQLLHRDAVTQIINWNPQIVLVSGPPFYLKRLPKKKKEEAWRQAVRLSKSVDILIIDHHFLRNNEGYGLLKKIELESGRKVMCAADFMKKRPLLLEANRKLLYKEMPVPDNWHREYSIGRTNTSKYRVWRGYFVDQR
ncbi:MAG: MBL fold metallo-hydrolase [Acidobacteriota bacterium]